MARKPRDFDELPCFWGFEQAAQILSLGDPRQAWRSHRAWQCRTRREARAQRSVPLRLREAVSGCAAWRAAAMTARCGTTIF